MENKESISKEEYHQLVGLLVLAKRKNRELDELVEAAAEITGQKCEDGSNYHGVTSDAIWEGDSADQLLNKLDIRVEDE